jgi:hypothetical protein
LICIYIRGHKTVTNTVSIFIYAGALAIASVLLYPKTLGGCVVFSGSVPLSKSFADKVSPEARKVTPRSFPYAEHIRTIYFLNLNNEVLIICRHRYYGFMEWLMGWSYLKRGMLGVHF